MCFSRSDVGLIGDDVIQEVLFLSKDLSLDSAHTSVAVDVSGAENQAENLTDAGTNKYRSRNWFKCSPFSLVLNIPTTDELQADTKKLAVSATKLFTLVFTSSAFRVLLQDVLISSREVLAGTAATVSRTAGQVQVAAEKIEYMADPNHGPDPTQEDVSAAINEAGKNSAEAFVELQEDATDTARNVFITRIQGVGLSLTCNATY